MSRKHDNFVRLAESRVNKALEAIRLVGNLANRSNYEYSAEEARAIVTALNSSVAEIKSQFNRADGEGQNSFKLPRN